MNTAAWIIRLAGREALPVIVNGMRYALRFGLRGDLYR